MEVFMNFINAMFGSILSLDPVSAVKMVVMWAIGGTLIYLAIKKDMEPSLLLPMGFGAILVNLPLSGAIDQMHELGIEVGALSELFRAGISNELFPLLLFIGIGAMLYNLQAAVSNFEYVLSFASLVFVVIVPVLTMRVLAEERRQRTDQLLYSLPITTVQIIAGKYLALLVLYLIPLAIIAVYPLIFAQFGDVYLLTSYGSILAFFLLGAALIAVGVFLSSLTDNQGLAAGLGIAVILLNYYSVSLSEYVSSTPVGALAALLVLILAVGAVVRYLTRNSNLAYGVCLVLLAAVAALYFVDSTAFEGLLPSVMSALSLFERFYTFVNGVFDLTAVFYYLTVAALFLFLSVQSLEKRRYN